MRYLAQDMKERFGTSIRRAPYVWLAVTILLTFVANTPLFAIVNDRDESKTWIAVAAAVLIAYNVVVWFVLLPRLASRSTITPSRLAAVRWSIAICPYVIAFAAVAIGGINFKTLKII